MHYRPLLLVVILCILLFLSPSNSFAEPDAEVILRALIKKGILTQEDIEAAAQEVDQEKDTQPASAPGNLQERVTVLEEKVEKGQKWLDKIQTKGDLRLRHEIKDRPQGENVNRSRLRFRWGLEAEVNEQAKVGFGFATGSSDGPTSTNQTLEQEFQSKDIWLDYGYGQLAPNEHLTFLLGKFKSPFFHTDMLWDSDIRFDGFAIKGEHPLALNGNDSDTEIFVSGGYFPIDDSADGMSDIFLTAVQTGIDTNLFDLAQLKTGITYYNFHNFKGRATSSFAEAKGTNTTATGSVLANNFSIVSPIVDLTFEDPFDKDVPVSFFYEFAENTGVDSDKANEAWRVGMKVSKGSRKKGDWRFLGHYSRLESDAFVDSFPDASFSGGGTNAKGFELLFDYAIMDNLVFGVDYYNTRAITGAESNEEVIQTNLMFYY